MRSWGQPPNQAVAHKRSQNIGNNRRHYQCNVNISSFPLSVSLPHSSPPFSTSSTTTSVLFSPSFFSPLFVLPVLLHKLRHSGYKEPHIGRWEGAESEEGSDAAQRCVFIRVFVFLCVRKSESVRRQEIARVERVGSTPRGTEKEQREHLPPHQEQLFNPPRRGDAGMGGAAKGRKVAGTATLVCFSLSPAHLYSLFKLSPTLSLYPVGSRRLVV